MTTNRGWHTWKTWITIALAAPLALDLGLAVYLWQASRHDPEATRAARVDKITTLTKNALRASRRKPHKLVYFFICKIPPLTCFQIPQIHRIN